MVYLRSKYRSGFDNLDIDGTTVKKIKLSPVTPAGDKLCMTYFLGTDDKLLRTWRYDSDQNRQVDLEAVLKKYPNLTVE